MRSAFGDEIVAAPVADGDVGEFADWEGIVDEDGAVDVGGVHFGAGDAGFFDEDLHGAADLGGVEAFGEGLEFAHGAVPAAFDGFVMDASVHVVGFGAFFAAVAEDACAFEFGIADEVEEFGEVFFGFAGEADDESGADGEAGDAGAHAVDEVADVVAGGFALHGSEHAVGDVLEGDIDVASDLGGIGDGADEFVAPVGWVGVEETDPEVAFDGIEGADERGETFAFGAIDGAAWVRADVFPFIHAEVGGVLADEIDFADTGLDELGDLADDAVLGAAAVAAADAGDDAERAGVVAALGDFDVGGVSRREAEAGRVVVRDVFGLTSDEIFRAFGFFAEEAFDDGGDLSDLVEADEGIDFGHEAWEFFGEALGETTSDDDFLAFPFFVGGAVIDGVLDGADAFLFRHVDERAGIDDEDVGVGGFRGHFHASLAEVADHDFGIDEIFGAAEGDETDFDHGRMGGERERRRSGGVVGAAGERRARDGTGLGSERDFVLVVETCWVVLGRAGGRGAVAAVALGVLLGRAGGARLGGAVVVVGAATAAGCAVAAAEELEFVADDLEAAFFLAGGFIFP